VVTYFYLLNGIGCYYFCLKDWAWLSWLYRSSAMSAFTTSDKTLVVVNCLIDLPFYGGESSLLLVDSLVGLIMSTVDCNFSFFRKSSFKYFYRTLSLILSCSFSVCILMICFLKSTCSFLAADILNLFLLIIY